jgi:hypothetical protein
VSQVAFDGGQRQARGLSGDVVAAGLVGQLVFQNGHNNVNFIDVAEDGTKRSRGLDADGAT